MSQPYFYLCAVWVPTVVEAESFPAAVRDLRRDLGLRVDFEFKFAKAHRRPDIRERFLELARAQPFRCVAASLDKTQARWGSASGPVQHHACVTELAARLRSIYLAEEQFLEKPLRERIIVDDNRDKAFLSTIRMQFHALQSVRHANVPLVGKVPFHDSGPDEVLQLADMVCGAIRVASENGDTRWRDIIADREIS